MKTPATGQPWVAFMLQSLNRFSPVLGRHFAWCARLTLWAAVASLAACSSVGAKLPAVDGIVSPYKIDIVQGNVVTREQAEALRPGMAREQVRDILGSPLLTSVFHADRWDYVFTFRRQGQPSQSRRLTVFFKDAVLERFESDKLPSESEFVATLDATRKGGKVPPLQATPEQLRAFAVSNAANAAVPPAAPAVPAPAASYPPLEAAK